MKTYEPTEAKTAAFLGLGVMGHPMAGHLARAGHRVTVYNRTAAKAAAWTREYGGSAAATPREAAAARAAAHGARHQPGGGFLHQAGRRASGVAIDRPCWRIRRIARHARQLQRQAVRHAVVPRRVGEPHRVLRRHGIEIGRAQEAALGQLALVPSSPAHPLAGGMAGSIAASGRAQPDFSDLARGVVRGSVVASFTCESFGVKRLAAVTRDEAAARVADFRRFTAWTH